MNTHMKRWNIPGVHYPDEPRWKNTPGVTYPDKQTSKAIAAPLPKPRSKPRRKRCETVAEVPEGYCTKEYAAKIIGCERPATAAQYLRVHDVRTIKEGAHRYYSISDVYALSREIPREIPAGYIRTEEAVRILGLCRASLQRHACKGEINSCYYINHIGKYCCAYNEQDVRDLAQYLKQKHNNSTQK